MADSTEVSRRLRAGQSARKIAEDLGVSLRRVYQVRGVKRPREAIDAIKSTRIRAAVAGGMSLREAARQFGASRKTIEKLARDLAAPGQSHAEPAPSSRARGRISADNTAHILARHGAGRSVGTIARECGLDAQAVRSVLARHAATGGKIDPADVIMTAVAAEMARRGLTAHGLAELLPRGTPTREKLYSYLRGEETPPTTVAAKLLKALGLAVRR